MENLAAFLIAGFALIASPGPNTLLAAASGAACGRRESLPIIAGMSVGMVVIMSLTASGVTGLMVAVPGAIPVLTGLAVAYFLYLAYRIATAPPLSDDDSSRRVPAFSTGFGICIVNPKAYAAMTALFSGFVIMTDSAVLDAVVKIVILTVMIVFVNVTWLTVGSALTRVFRDPKANRIINICFAAMLLGTLALMLL